MAVYRRPEFLCMCGEKFAIVKISIFTDYGNLNPYFLGNSISHFPIPIVNILNRRNFGLWRYQKFHNPNFKNKFGFKLTGGYALKMTKSTKMNISIRWRCVVKVPKGKN